MLHLWNVALTFIFLFKFLTPDTGMTLSEGWDGEGVGGGFRMGNTCTPMADSSQCMAKPKQCCKVK